MKEYNKWIDDSSEEIGKSLIARVGHVVIQKFDTNYSIGVQIPGESTSVSVSCKEMATIHSLLGEVLETPTVKEECCEDGKEYRAFKAWYEKTKEWGGDYEEWLKLQGHKEEAKEDTKKECKHQSWMTNCIAGAKTVCTQCGIEAESEPLKELVESCGHAEAWKYGINRESCVRCDDENKLKEEPVKKPSERIEEIYEDIQFEHDGKWSTCVGRIEAIKLYLDETK